MPSIKVQCNLHITEIQQKHLASQAVLVEKEWPEPVYGSGLPPAALPSSVASEEGVK